MSDSKEYYYMRLKKQKIQYRNIQEMDVSSNGRGKRVLQPSRETCDSCTVYRELSKKSHTSLIPPSPLVHSLASVM